MGLKTGLSPAGSVSWLHVAIVIAVSVGYESLFIHHGINRIDESWPLYAGMQLSAGGTLYGDVLWVFPPGHVWIGWLAHALDAPGFVFARTLYAALTVALCATLYALGCRVMPRSYALLGVLLLAIAAPRGHIYHLLFGYRYLVWTVLALLAYDRRLRTGDLRWMLVAGLLAGWALVFRLTPAFAVSCGIGIAVITADPRPREWLRDWTAYGVGLLIPTLPMLAYFASTVGVEQFWHEAVVHPLVMLERQSIPIPPMTLAGIDWGDRESVYRGFLAFQYRLHWLVYGGYAIALGALYARSRTRGATFGYPLLLAVVIWGGVFSVRSVARADEPHLDTTVPAFCLLLGGLVGLALQRVLPPGWSPRRQMAALAAAGAAVLGAWIYVLGVDLYVSDEKLGSDPLYSTSDSIEIAVDRKADAIDGAAALIETNTAPDDRILVVDAAPLFYVLTGRRGPGYLDIVMPGTFITEQDEIDFLKRLKSDPPAAVVWPAFHFDDLPERRFAAVAPRLAKWVRRAYRPIGPTRRWIVMLRRGAQR